MKLREIVENLERKQPLVVAKAARLRDAIRIMNENNVGALLVVDLNGVCQGIISERDIMRHIEKGSLQIQVHEASTPKDRMVFGRLEDEVEQATLVMDQRHIRHLPVLDSTERVIALLSIRDLLRTKLEDAEDDRKALMGYISGSYPVA
jgi:CBS domain-containing protein